MKHSLLVLVQDMLGAIDAEGVEDVADTEEAALCVSIANRAYEAIIYKYKWKHLKRVTNLISGSFNNQLAGPTDTIHIDARSIYYASNFVSYLYPKDFLGLTEARTIGTNITTIDNIKVVTNQDPVWFTSFNDTDLVFDATPTTSALTAGSSKSIVWVGPSSRLSANAEVFDMPAIAYPAIEDWAIGIAIKELKGDTATGNDYIKEANKKLAVLTQKGDLIEKNPDILKNVISRRSFVNRKFLNVGNIATA